MNTVDPVYLSGFLDLGDPTDIPKRFDVLIYPTHALVFYGRMMVFKKQVDCDEHVYAMASSLQMIHDKNKKDVIGKEVFLAQRLRFLPVYGDELIQTMNVEQNDAPMDIAFLLDYGRYPLKIDGRYGELIKRIKNCYFTLL